MLWQCCGTKLLQNVSTLQYSSYINLHRPEQMQCHADIKKMQMPPGDKSLRVTVFASKLEAWLRFAHLPYRIERSATLKGAPKGQVCPCNLSPCWLPEPLLLCKPSYLEGYLQHWQVMGCMLMSA